MDDETIDLGTVDLGAMPKGQDAKEAFENLAGDADFGDGSGHIKVDRSVPSHPVVRLVNVEGLGGGGDGKDGVGIKEVVLDSYDAETRTSTYNVMSDEDPSQVLGTFTVTDGADGEDGADSTVPGPQGVGIKEVVLDSYDSSSRTYTYNVMSDETPSRVLGSFTVKDGQDGTPGGGGGGGGDNEDLTVYGNPTNYNGNATETTTYNGSAPKDIHLEGLVTLGTNQTITGRKTFNQQITVVPATPNGNESYIYPGLWILYTAENGYAVRFRGGANGHECGAIFVNQSANAIVVGGLTANTTYIFASPTTAPSSATGDAAKLVATLGWVEKYFIRKLFAGNVSIAYDAPAGANGTISIGKNDASGTKEDKVGLELHLLPQPVVSDGNLMTKYGSATATQLFSANQPGDATLTFNNLTVKGNQNDDGTVSSPSDDTYNTGAPKTINLNGFVTKGTAQTISGRKTFNQYITVVPSTANGNASYMHPGLWILYTAESGYAVRFRGGSNGHEIGAIYVNTGSGTAGGAISLGGLSADTTYLFATPRTLPANATGEADKLVATLGWVTKYFQLKLTQGAGISLAADPNDTNKVKISCTVEAAKDGTLKVQYGSSGTETTKFTANQSGNSTLTFENLTVKGNQNDDGTVSSPSDDTYNTGAAKTINLKGFVTKGTEQEINGYKKFNNNVRIQDNGSTVSPPLLVVGEATTNSNKNHTYYENSKIAINSDSPKVLFRKKDETLIGSIEGEVDGNNKLVVITADANGAQLANAPTTTLDSAANSKAIATLGWVASKLKTLSHGSTALGKIFASQNATIQRKQLVQGNGIVLTENGNQITISATGGGGGSGTSGYSTPSGTTDKSVADIMYDKTEHKFKIKYNSDVYANGLLVSRTTDSDWGYMDGGDAVEETV